MAAIRKGPLSHTGRTTVSLDLKRDALDGCRPGAATPTPPSATSLYFYGLERRLVKDRSEADALQNHGR